MERKRLHFIQTILFCRYLRTAMALIQMRVDGGPNQIGLFLMVGLCLKPQFRMKKLGFDFRKEKRDLFLLM